MVLNIAIVILFAITLKYFASVAALRKYRKTIAFVFLGLFSLILGEYQINQAFNPLVFSYSRDVPAVYYDIKNDKNINAIAEYPLDRPGVEHDSLVYYLTMQAVHQKKLLNSVTTTSGSEPVQIALKDLADPQTLPALRYLGIKYVVIHGMTEKEILAQTNELRIIMSSRPQIYGLSIVRAGDSNDIVLAQILDGPKTDSVLTIEKGFAVNLDIMKMPLGMEYETVQDTQLKLTPLSEKSSRDPKNVCFEAKMSAKGDAGDLTVSVNSVPQLSVPISDGYTPLELNAKTGDIISLHNSKGYNVRLNNLGCRE